MVENMNTNKKTKFVALLIALVLAGVQGIPAVQACEQEQQQSHMESMFRSECSGVKDMVKSITMNIEFRPGVTADMNVLIYKNSVAKYHFYADSNQYYSGKSKGKVGYAGAGFAHNGSSYEPLISALFKENRDISTMIVPDIPGNGNSSMPEGILFGDMTLQDYANIDRLVLEGLKEKGINIDFAIFHSQHGLTAAMTQEQVNLKKYGIDDVILIAPAPPQQVPWQFLSNMNPYTFLPYLAADSNGMYVSLPPADWIGFFFMKPDGTLNSEIPTLTEVDRWDANAPLTATLQLLGIEIVSLDPPVLRQNISLRPYVSEGVFRKNGPKLWIIAYGDDTIVGKQAIEGTSEILTGKKENKNIITIPGAVHDYHLTRSGSVVVAETINKILK